jgi:hypothetical protein
LHTFIRQQLGTAKDQQVKGQLTEIQTLIQQHLPEMKIQHLCDTLLILLRNNGRKFLNRIAVYKKLIDELNAQTGNQPKTQEDITARIEATKQTIKDTAKALGKTIKELKDAVEVLQEGANTIAQELQSRQSSTQQQEIASVIQEAVSAIGDISNRISSIVQKLENLENIFAQIQQEVNQLMEQGEQQTARTATSSDKGSTDSTTSAPSEQDLPTQLDELEKRIVDLYRAVVALETVVNIATSAASIVPPKIAGMDTASLAQKFVSIRPQKLYIYIDAIKQYTGLNLPHPFGESNQAEQQKQGNVTQPYFLKQQEVSSTDIPESIKSYLEEVKTFLLGARNQMEANLNSILDELSKLGEKLDQISDIKIKRKAQRIYSTPTFVILDECKSKLTENMSPSLIETIAPIVGATLIAVEFWDSFLDWNRVGTAMTNLQNIATGSQDPVIQTALSNTLGSASHQLKQSNPALNQPPVPHATAHEIGASVLAALTSKYVHSPEVLNALETQGWSQQQEGFRELRVITDSDITKKIKDVVVTRGVIPSFEMIQGQKGSDVVKNIKMMINAFAGYMAEHWTEIVNQINKDIEEGRLSDPQKKIQHALVEVNNAWINLLNKMQSENWREFFLSSGIEKTKIEKIKRELEQLIDACFELLEAWEAAPKPKKGALDIEELLFHPLGLPALKAALRTLPPSIPGGVTIRRVTQTGGTQAGGTQRGGTQRGGTQAGGTQAGGTQRGGTQAGGTQAGGTQAGGTQRGGTQTGGGKIRLKYRGRTRGIGAQQMKAGSKGGPTYFPSPGDKETTEKTLQEEITRAINFIKERQVDNAIKAVANAIMVLRDIDKQKTQARGAPLTHLQEAASYLSVALRRLRDAGQLEPDSDGFNANLSQANSLLQEALKVLSNPTAGRTPYLGRKLLLLMKTLSTTPTTARSHRQRVKNEDILEKETI